MPRGPRTKPAALKDRDGNPGGHPYQGTWVEPLKEMPPCPSRFKGMAKKVWNEIGPQLIADGLISERDLMPFTAYCEMFETVEQINKQMLEKEYSAPLILDSNTKIPRINPLFRFKHQVLQQIRVFGAEFGLTPSSRTRAGLKPYRQPSPQEDPMKEFMPQIERASGIRR